MRAVIALLALAVVGCAAATPSGGAASHPSRVNLGVANGTTLAVTLFVNGVRVAEFPPRGPEPSFDIAALPALPWTVEARSPSGRVLTSMRVDAKDIWTTARPGGAIESSGAMARVDLSCGSLRIWAGDIMPSGPIPASPPGTPGDCEP
jgi:hypothetical protein